MEKNQFELVIRVLKELENAGLLEKFILVGSWAIYFYRYYFKSESYISTIRTRDMDFVIPLPYKDKKKIDIKNIFEKMGFIIDRIGEEGIVQFKHEELTVEFLVNEKGRSNNLFIEIPQLGIKAQPLRYLSILEDNTVIINVEGINLKVPHPAAYALHKFIIFKRRRKIDKKERDLESAYRVFLQILETDRKNDILKIFKNLHPRWQKTIIKNLQDINETEILNILNEFQY